MKNIIIIVVAVFAVGSIAAYAYYAQTRISNLEADNAQMTTQVAGLQSELGQMTTEKEALTLTVENQNALENTEAQQLKDFMDVLIGEVSVEEEISSEEETLVEDTGETATGALVESEALTATGATTDSGAVATETLTEPVAQKTSLFDTLYNPAVFVEGPVSANNLIKYKLALKDAPASEYEFKGYPLQLSQGDWTMVVSLYQLPVNNPIQLVQTGATVPATTDVAESPKQKLTLTLAKWRAGKIVEQYTFEYPEIIEKSRLAEYVK